MSVLNDTDELLAINEATQDCFKALLSLSNEARQRVLQSVTAQLGMTSGSLSNPIPSAARLAGSVSQESSSGDFATDRTMSPKTFMLDKRPRSDVERIACLAYYLTHYRDTPHFKTVEISKLNTEAAQQKLSNPSHAVNNAAQMGYLVPASKGQKQLSAAGELFVSALPDRDAAKEAMAHARPRKTGRKKPTSDSGSNNG